MNRPSNKPLQRTDHAALLAIHRAIHSWDEVPVINERDQWTVKRVKELLLAYQAATRPPYHIISRGRRV